MSPRPLAIVSADPEVVSACRQAAGLVPEAVGEVRVLDSPAALEAARDGLEGLVVLDPALFQERCVHEWTLDFLRQGRALVFLLTAGRTDDADGLARFVGAQGALPRPPEPQRLAELLAHPFGAGRRPAPELPERDEARLGERLGEALEGKEPPDSRDRFLRSITDPETGLYTAEFWEHRLDEEFKRSHRFRYPLGLVAFAFDGEADLGTLLDIAGVILLDTRDVDIVARFDARTFVALLPHTGPAGVSMFAERVRRGLEERALTDLVGEPLDWTVATALCPDPELRSSREFLRRVVPDCNLLT